MPPPCDGMDKRLCKQSWERLRLRLATSVPVLQRWMDLKLNVRLCLISCVTGDRPAADIFPSSRICPFSHDEIERKVVDQSLRGSILNAKFGLPPYRACAVGVFPSPTSSLCATKPAR